MAGGGFMGKAHSNAFATIPYIFYPREYELELTAVAASSQESARIAADRYGFARAFGGWNEMLDGADFDVFDNGGPDPTHYPSVIKAIALGRHIYCEKPIA
ncbi:MAG: Gfo/Idh/MocA family oxidoreductase, partial [Synergistaceae bacterium]|nr:Gfo/Idh/MocA family oxidoreductase [Synergistaceae bacterium]